MRYAAEDEEEPPALRRLRLLVMVMMVVLMIGILTIAATIVIRLGFGGAAATAEPVSASELIVPQGEVLATGQGPGTVHVLLRSPDGEEVLLVYDAGSGAQISATKVTRGGAGG